VVVPTSWAYIDTYVLAVNLADRLPGVLDRSNLKLGTIREAFKIPAPRRVHRWGGGLGGALSRVWG